LELAEYSGEGRTFAVAHIPGKRKAMLPGGRKRRKKRISVRTSTWLGLRIVSKFRFNRKGSRPGESGKGENKGHSEGKRKWLEFLKNFTGCRILLTFAEK